MDVNWIGIVFGGFLPRPLRMEISHGRLWSYRDRIRMDGGVRFPEYMDV